jgi:hypothetical protein
MLLHPFISECHIFVKNEYIKSKSSILRTDVPSRIGGRRGIALAVLFPPPSSEPDVLVFKHPARQLPLLSLWPLRISRSRIRFERFPCHPSPYDWFSQPSWQVVTPATTTVTPSP